MHIKTDIKYTLSLEESLEMEAILNTENISTLLRYVNQHIAYKDNRMVGCWAYANHYVPAGKPPPTEPKGTFKPNSFLFKALKDSCIIISKKNNNSYVKELRIQTVPLPL